jgi:1-acyl-sn-glycerol-3-phosphate acyltransferase
MIYIVRYALISVFTVIWGTIGCTWGLLDGDRTVWVAQNWITWILKSCGIQVIVEGDGLDQLGEDRPVVLMSNHQSVFDIAAIVTTWYPRNWRFVAKRELTWIPFFGWALKLGGHVIIDRGRRASAVKSLQSSADQVRRGTTVMIFPEGTRGGGGEMLPFKSGGFHLATQAGVPILPVSVSGSAAITPKGSLRIESGLIRIRYGTPIETRGRGDGEADRQALKDEVRAAIEAGLAANGLSHDAAA